VIISNGASPFDIPELRLEHSFLKYNDELLNHTAVSLAKELKGFWLSVVGINCCTKLEDNYKSLKGFPYSTNTLIWFKPNSCDKPDKPVYDITQTQMVENVVRFVESGAKIIGGCYDTTPNHLKAIADVVKAVR